jgi:hypothetical protein
LMRNPKSAGTSLTKLTLGISSEKLSLWYLREQTFPTHDPHIENAPV